MKFITAAYYEFIKHIRDIKMAGILLIFPILSIYILGNTMGNLSTDITDKIPVGYVNQDTGDIGKAFDKFLESEEIKDHLEIHIYNDIDTGKTAVDNGEIDSLIQLPEKLSENLSKGENQSILIYGKKNTEPVEAMFDGFISSINSVNSILAVSGIPVLPDRTDTIERIFYTKDAILPTMTDYYSVLTLLQVLFIGAIFGVFIVSKNSESDMHIRINSLPVGKWTLLAGRILGSVAYLFSTALIVLLFTKFAYNANWNGNLFIILGALLAFCVISIGIGMLIKLLITNTSTSLMILMLLMIFFGTVSGAVSPASTGGLGFLSPNYHARTLIFGTIYGYSSRLMLEAVLCLGGLMVIIYGINAILIRREKYDNI